MRYRRVVIPGATYFFTLVTERRRPFLADVANVARWHQSVGKVKRARPFVVDAEVILPDHIHMLWTLPPGDSDYATRIRLIKTSFTKSLIGLGPSSNDSRAGKGERDVWQRRYWEHTIRNESDFCNHLDYIHYNPVRHGLVARPVDWPHSTLRAWIERGVYDIAWGSDEMPEWAAFLEREHAPE